MLLGGKDFVRPEDLCASIAKMTKRLCSEYVDPQGISSLLACRLIALDKSPGVRPIGVGEVLRRVIAKAALHVTSDDIISLTGPFQLCTGHTSGCEAGAHSMRMIYENPNTEAILLIDAMNAFNSLNREAALTNIQSLCPSIAPFLINSYRNDNLMFINGEVIFSKEGTTQGDPMAMPMYALSTLPLIWKVANETNQIWYADDASAGGSVNGVRDWWEKIQQEGPRYGYFPNSNKSWLIVKAEYLATATDAFAGSGINITSKGHQHLGIPVGTRKYIEEFVSTKVEQWLKQINELTIIAETQPQAAYAAITHGIMEKWNYFMRTIPDIEPPYSSPLKMPYIRGFYLSSREGWTSMIMNEIFSHCQYEWEVSEFQGLMPRHRSNSIHHWPSLNPCACGTCPLALLWLPQLSSVSIFYRKEEQARNFLKTTIEDINCVFVAFCNDLLHIRSKNWHYVQYYKNWLFARGFAKGAPNDTVSGLLATPMHYLKVYRGGF